MNLSYSVLLLYLKKGMEKKYVYQKENEKQ